MKLFKRFSIVSMSIILSVLALSLCAFASGATEQKVYCTYDEESGILKADIYVSNGTAIVGYCSFDYDEKTLSLLDIDKKIVPELVPDTLSDGKTLYLKNIFESHNSIVVTDIGNGTKKLVNTKDGYAMFAWYFSDSKSVIDATNKEVLIASFQFSLKEGKTLSDINEKSLTFAPKQITDTAKGWYPAIFVMDKNHNQYSYENGTLKAEIIFDIDKAGVNVSNDSNDNNEESDSQDDDKNSESTNTQDNKQNTENPPSDNTNQDGSQDENEGSTETDNTEDDNQNTDIVPSEPTTNIPENGKAPAISVNAIKYDFKLSHQSTETTIRLKWNRPETFNFAYYTIRIFDQNKNLVRYIDGISGVTNSFTVRDIAHDFIYYVTLCAYDENSNEYVQTDYEAKTLRFEGTAEMIINTVTYDATVGYLYGFSDESVIFGEKAQKIPSVIAPEGLYFIGWSENGKTPIDISAKRIYSDTTYYAVYTKYPDVYKKGYISGYNDGTFLPEGTLKRSECASLFAKVSGEYDENKVYSCNFSDVNQNDWFKNVVSFCSEKGYIGGYENGSFGPDNTITRAEFAAIVCRIFGFEATKNKDYFSDISSHWAKSYANALFENCASLPFTDGKFMPDKKITRRQAVLILNSALGIIPDNEEIIEYVRENGKDGKIFTDISLSDKDFFEIARAAIGTK